MKNLKCIFGLFLLIFALNLSAQQANYVGHVTLLKKNASMLSFGGGISSPGSDAKDKAYVSNSIALNADLFLPLIRKGWDGVVKGTRDRPKLTFGLNFGGTYNLGGSGDFGANYKLFSITAEVQPQGIIHKGTDPRNPAFKFGAGPQANFYFGDFIISPMVLGEYYSMTQKELSAVQTSQFNGKTYNFNLATLPETKTSGFAVTPKLRFQYFFTKNMGLWLEGNYSILPKIKTLITTFTPNGNPGQDGSYNIDQMITGTNQTHEISVNNSSFGFGGGIVINISGRKGWNGKIEESTVNNTITTEEEKLPANIQKLIDEQNTKMNVTFQKVKSSNMKANSLCNFSVEKVEIECNGKDAQGNKKYKVKIVYKNLSTSGVGSLGHYLTACNATTTNGNYIETMPSGSATITSLSPSTSAKTLVPPLSSQTITFDFVPSSGFTTLNIKGNVINSATSCGNCDDIISLNLPNCCDGCELNPVTVINRSITSIDDNNGTINIKNIISSPNNIVKIEADLVNVKIIPNNNDCLKCNDKIKKQDHFVDKNQIINNTGWANTGNPTKYEGENSDATVSRSLTYTTTSPTGINLSSGAQFNHTIGVSPTSCCGDTVEIWIRYTVWDKDCHVCDKLVKSVITRKPTCNSNSGTNGTGQSTGSAINMGTLKN